MKSTSGMALAARYTALRLVGLAFLFLPGFTAQAQIDTAPRQLLHLGAEISLHDDGPYGAYGFYYLNLPNVPATNVFLRLAFAGVYADGEVAFKGLLGENTDLAIGGFGGLYASDYYEVRHGNYFRGESFDGNNAGGSVSIYHRFNPNSRIPLTGVLRGTGSYDWFDNTKDTDNAFDVPPNQPVFTARAGLRWGGVEPVLNPVLAMEVSSWYELEQRTDSGLYGFSGDRRLESTVQRAFGRAVVRYTTLEWKHYIVASLQGGTSFNPDRFGCYRLGGTLDYTKEFPLNIPGYFYQELSAKDFGLVNASYTIPFGAAKQWSITGSGAAALVAYLPGTGKSGSFNSGAGAGIGYAAPNRRWKVTTFGGYGFEAQRSNHAGGYSAGLACQINFGETKFDSDYAYEELQREHGVTP